MFIGVDLGGTKIFAALVSAAGAVTDEIYVAHQGTLAGAAGFSEAEGSAGPVYARLVETIEALKARALSRGQPIFGIGVGAAGITRPDGMVISGPALGWRDFPLGAILAARVGLPVRVENDVNLQALGEYGFGAGRGLHSLFLMAVGTGIGGAVILDGKLWRGRNLAGGEIGAMVPGREYLSKGTRDWGALESVASGSGISAEARRITTERGLEIPKADLRGEAVFAAAKAGIEWAEDVETRTLDLWAVGLSAIQAILDPDIIVLGGGAAADTARFIPLLEARLNPVLPFGLRLVGSKLGYRAGVLGTPGLFSDQSCVDR